MVMENSIPHGYDKWHAILGLQLIKLSQVNIANRRWWYNLCMVLLENFSLLPINRESDVAYINTIYYIIYSNTYIILAHQAVVCIIIMN